MSARLLLSNRPEPMRRVQASIAASPDPRTQSSRSSAAAGMARVAKAIRPARAHVGMSFAIGTKRPPLFGLRSVASDALSSHSHARYGTSHSEPVYAVVMQPSQRNRRLTGVEIHVHSVQSIVPWQLLSLSCFAS